MLQENDPRQNFDNRGREYARISELVDGSRVEIDSGFDCAAPGTYAVVQYPGGGHLYFRCDHGVHSLDGQLLDDGDHLVGVYGPIVS